MDILSSQNIAELHIRGSFFNRRTLLSRRALTAAGQPPATQPIGYLPPVVSYRLDGAAQSSITVRETDLPTLCNASLDDAKTHLALILNARSGHQDSAHRLACVRTAEGFLGISPVPPSESRYVVPSSSAETHSEQEISQKAFILLKLSQMGYPVPDFAVLTTQSYAERHKDFELHLAEAIRQLELLTMQKLGDPKEPLIFALRCATAYYIPGLLDTYLNVGVTPRTLPSLEKIYGRLAAHKMFLNNLRNLCQALGREEHSHLLGTVRADLTDEQVVELTGRLCEELNPRHRELIEDPYRQADFLARQAYQHFEANQELVLALCRGAEHYPSLILQKMVCTVRDQESYVGVVHSRHSQTGVGIELQTAHNVFGEEMMTGTAEAQPLAFEDPETIRDTFPAVHHFVPSFGHLEREFEAPATIEFAVEATERHQLFALLQLNQTGMVGRAAVLSAVDMHKSGIISRQRVTELIRPYHIKQLTSDTIDEHDLLSLHKFCSGVSVLPRSAVSARVYFSGGAALTAKGQGEKVCLCKQTFLPTDSAVMREMDAIISLTSAAVHVVTICQSLGIPGLLSMEKSGVRLEPQEDGGLINAEGVELHEGDWVTISSRLATVYVGRAHFRPGRLLRFMQGESFALDGDEKTSFAQIAYAFRYYQQLNRGLEFDQTSTLSEVIRLVNFELRTDTDSARRLVNAWFDNHEELYSEEVLKSDIGDHLGQSNVFEMLTIERKIRFFRRTLAMLTQSHLSGYEAGAFMLGRFLCLRYPVKFWKAFTPIEIGLLVNEWVLFEKYMQVLHNVGERRVLLARKQILKNGLEELALHAGNLSWGLITLKLSHAPLEEAVRALPDWSDAQTRSVLDMLQQPFRYFYDFKACWSVRQLEKICKEENIRLPNPDDR